MNAARKAASADFAKLVEMFDEYGVSFVSVTQSFNTTTSMGRLTLNVLLSFAQFERNFSLWSSIGGLRRSLKAIGPKVSGRNFAFPGMLMLAGAFVSVSAGQRRLQPRPLKLIALERRHSGTGR